MTEPTGATSGFSAAMASIAFRVAAPIAVPRAVVRLSMTWISFDLSVVGASTNSANPVKATMPMRVPSTCPSTNARAASWATANRFGLMSVAHIERETSSARMIDVRPRATSTATWGRAVAMASTAMVARNSATGT